MNAPRLLGVAAVLFCACAQAALVAHWPFLNGSTVSDASGRGHNATVVGTVGWGAGPCGDGALLLNGTGYLTFPSSLDFKAIANAGVVSISAWFRWDTGSVFAMLDSPIGFSFEIDYFAHHISFRTAPYGEKYPPRRELQDGNWHQVVMAMDVGQNNTLFWWNGTSPENGDGQNVTIAKPSTFYIGYGPYGSVNDIFGAIQDLRVYSHFLSDVEVAEIFNNPCVPPPPDPVASSSFSSSSSSSPAATTTSTTDVEIVLNTNSIDHILLLMEISTVLEIPVDQITIIGIGGSPGDISVVISINAAGSEQLADSLVSWVELCKE